jgi:DNA primase small subunit
MLPVILHFIREKFAEYYEKHSSSVLPPASIERREFGFLLFKENIMLRHKSFGNMQDFRSFLGRVVPSNVYYSGAYYEKPESEMEEKDWLGADLVFDIDADHIPTPCNKVHDKWICGNCGFVGRGPSPEICPVCGSQKFDIKTWPCEVCLKSAKVETVKLLDMLMSDFGFSEKEIRVFFSGHRGYHVHVESEVVKTLDAVARKEIVDYVSGLGFDAVFHGLGERGWRAAHVLRGPSLNDSGWRGRVAKGVYDFILDAEEAHLKFVGLKKNAIAAILENRDMILKSWEDAGPWSAIKGVGFETWKKIAIFCAKSQSANVDTVVTTDIHRLIRLAGTLHGKTGLKKVEFPVSAIEGFNPFKSAVAFKKGTATVLVSDAPKFTLGDEVFGPYKERRVELPTAAALLLVCKGRAEVVE